MKKLIIYLSKDDDFLGSAQKIEQISKIETQIIYIEDYLKNTDKYIITKDDIIYFICNGINVNMAISKIENIGCYIINKKYLSKNFPKDEIQQLIHLAGIRIPRLISIDDLETEKMPIFCKQNTHTGIVFKAYTRRTIIDFFSKFKKSQFYLEESLTKDNLKHNEFKAYYVNGCVFSKDGAEKFSDEVVMMCEKIGKNLFDLQAFSVDFIENENGLYVIDVNVASGFYMCTDARIEFVNAYLK